VTGDVELRRLAASDRRDLFDCGDEAINEFLKTKANQSQKRGQSATHVAVRATQVVGFVTVLPGSLEPAVLAAKSLVKNLPGQHVPVLLLARMGTTKGLGLGRRLVEEVVFVEAQRLRDSFGCVGILTDAKPGAVGFYAKLGFVELAPPVSPEATTRMFIVPRSRTR
jgi:ribosomal protein S18 acetylase RimI-like enzyme